jgi:hypothetical protein
LVSSPIQEGALTLMEIVFTKRDRHPKYGELLAPEKPNTVEGYNEVYELGGLFFAYSESYSGGASRSVGHRTQDEAVADLEESAQSHRNFWDEKVEWRKAGDRCPQIGEPQGARVIRAGHMHYVIGVELRDDQKRHPDARASLGHGGRKFVFRMLDTGEVITSTNVWSQGEIPAEYWVRLPDNAELLEP